MTYRARSSTSPVFKDDYFTSGPISLSRVGGRRNNAVAPGTVAARISFLQDLARSASAPTISTLASPRPDPRPLFSPGIGTTYRKPRNPLRESVAEKLARDSEDEENEQTFFEVDSPPRPSSIGYEQRSNVANETYFPTPQPASTGSEMLYSQSDRDSHRALPPSRPTDDLTKVIYNVESADHADRSSPPYSESSAITTSTNRRRSARELFNDYGLASPPELMSETGSLTLDNSMEQAIKYTYCHSCSGLNYWADEKCWRCNHRLCIDCDVLSAFLVSGKTSRDDSLDLVESARHRVAEQATQPSSDQDMSSSQATGVDTVTIGTIATPQRKTSPTERYPSLIPALQSSEQSERPKVQPEPVARPSVITSLKQHTSKLEGNSHNKRIALPPQPGPADKPDTVERPLRQPTVRSSTIQNNPFVIADRSQSVIQRSRTSPIAAIGKQRGQDRVDLASANGGPSGPAPLSSRAPSVLHSEEDKMVQEESNQRSGTQSLANSSPLSRLSISASPSYASSSLRARSALHEASLPTQSVTGIGGKNDPFKPAVPPLYDRSRLRSVGLPDGKPVRAVKESFVPASTPLSTAALREHTTMTQSATRDSVDPKPMPERLGSGKPSWDQYVVIHAATYKDSNPEYFELDNSGRGSISTLVGKPSELRDGIASSGTVTDRIQHASPTSPVKQVSRVRAMSQLLEKSLANSSQQSWNGNGKPPPRSEQDSVKVRAFSRWQDQDDIQGRQNGKEGPKVRRLSKDRMAFLDKAMQERDKQPDEPQERRETAKEQTSAGIRPDESDTSDEFRPAVIDSNCEIPQQESHHDTKAGEMPGLIDLLTNLELKKASDRTQLLEEFPEFPKRRMSSPEFKEAYQPQKQTSPSSLIRNIPGSFPLDGHEAHPSPQSPLLSPVKSRPSSPLKDTLKPTSGKSVSSSGYTHIAISPEKVSTKQAQMHTNHSNQSRTSSPLQPSIKAPSVEDKTFSGPIRSAMTPARTSSQKPSNHSNESQHSGASSPRSNHSIRPNSVLQHFTKTSSTKNDSSSGSGHPITISAQIISNSPSNSGRSSSASGPLPHRFTDRSSESHDVIWKTRFIFEPLSDAVNSHSDGSYIIETRALSPKYVRGPRVKQKLSEEHEEVHTKPPGSHESQEVDSEDGDLGIKRITVKVHFERRQDLVLKINLKGEGRGLVVMDSEDNS